MLLKEEIRHVMLNLTHPRFCSLSHIIRGKDNEIVRRGGFPEIGERN